MTYIPHTDADRAAMLAAIGISSLEELFEAVPAEHRFPPLNLPEALSEMEALWELQALASHNAVTPEYALFLGAG
ncbi:MAG: glycine dehydrogenase, partial [Anaerolineae bacterium]|nr:glycine dehydrogenase [Anaerolineae bacterium]